MLSATAVHVITSCLPKKALSLKDVQDFEAKIGFTLPKQYVDYLTRGCIDSPIDENDIFLKLEHVSECTDFYYETFADIKPWPPDFICIGDSLDLCPYVLNCRSGEILHIEKSRFDRPISRWTTFDCFAKELTETAIEVAGFEDSNSTDWLSVLITVLATITIVFVILPLFVYGIVSAFKWLKNLIF